MGSTQLEFRIKYRIKWVWLLTPKLAVVRIRRNTEMLSCYTRSFATNPCVRGRTLGLRTVVLAAMTDQNIAVSGGAQFLRPHLLKLAAYTPIEPFEILSARYGRQPEDIVKLDANENPYGPPPEVREALANMPFPHVYPDPETRRLRKALSEMNDIPMEHLLVRSFR